MKNWIANKIDGFNSISKMESYALNHFVYSTPFNQLFKGKFDVKRRRIVIILLALYWLLVVLMISKIIPPIKTVLRPYMLDMFSVLKEDTNSFIIMTSSYLITICYIKTDFIINESSSHLLYDINLLKNGFTNRLNKSNLEKMKIQSEFLYQFLKYVTSIFKIIFALFYLLNIISVLNNFNYIMKIIYIFGFLCWILAINHSIDLGGVYGMIISLSVSYMKFRFNQINEKLLLIYDGKKKLNIKKLLKIISEHKSIERKMQLYNSRINRSILCIMIGLTIGMIANLYIVTFSNDFIHRMFSLFTASGVLLFEIVVMIEMVALTDAAHWPYATLNSIIVKKKMNLKTKLKV